jgi:hypothetical protein
MSFPTSSSTSIPINPPHSPQQTGPQDDAEERSPSPPPLSSLAVQDVQDERSPSPLGTLRYHSPCTETPRRPEWTRPEGRTWDVPEGPAREAMNALLENVRANSVPVSMTPSQLYLIRVLSNNLGLPLIE